jgi:hypothetical protein
LTPAPPYTNTKHHDAPESPLVNNFGAFFIVFAWVLDRKHLNKLAKFFA